jgi:Zn-dependent M28 family amino/carboxypeptidase
MEELVKALCSDRCAGRAVGTPGGLLARALVVEAFADAGYDTELQPIPGVGGANVLARLPGERSRWVLVAAHYDHIGVIGGEIHRGADDNAAAVAILIEVARVLKERPPATRGVVFAAFDAEEPPNFRGSTMGSQYFVDHPSVPLDSIDMMVCMDLVGHAVGSEGMPDEIRNTVFALGAERSEGTAATVDGITHAVPGVIVRRIDAKAISPQSDYYAFWQRIIPFLFLSNGRSRIYHTPQDTVEKLDFGKMQATAEWLARFVRETCERAEARIEWRPCAYDDASTLRTLIDVSRALEVLDPAAAGARAAAEALLSACGPDGSLPEHHHGELADLIAMMEHGLA